MLITSVFYVNAGNANNKINFSDKVEISDLTTNDFLLNQPPVEQKKMVRGTIIDANGQTIPGASVINEGTRKGFISDRDGNYSIEAESQNVLVFSFMGFEIQKIKVGDRKIINVELIEKSNKLDDVTIVAFARQKKNSIMAAITTIKPSELKVPSSNLTTALAGRLSGVIAYQRSGEPGQDNAQFFIRGVTTMGFKKDPLILIDGIELNSTDLARLQPDDIASFSIMKDAAATALYGARGANGVIYVTTKEGVEGKPVVSVRYETSVSSNARDIEFADAVTYMKMNNEAIRTRDPLSPMLYSADKIANTVPGSNSYLYPATDWYNMLFKKEAVNSRLNLNISGGGKVARYYIAASVNQDNGIMNVDKKNNFNSNIDLKKYQMRMNLNLNLTKTTTAKFIFNANMDNYSGPITGGGDMFNNVMRTNPVLFAPSYQPDFDHRFTNHILFGNYGATASFLNPYADMVRGFKQYSSSRVLSQFEVGQDLDIITKGLKAKVIGYGNIYSYFDVQRSYAPFYYSPTVNPETGELSLAEINPNGGTEYLNYIPGSKDVSSTFYFEASTSYNRTFNEKHGLSGLLVYTMRSELNGNAVSNDDAEENKIANALQRSLPNRNIGLAGRFTYSYDDKYFLEGNFGYNGSERFAAKNRFGFFPSAGLGYLISNEKFFAPLKRTVSKLKLKATYGIVGNDAIGNANDRFFYLSQVNMDNGDKSLSFGKYFNYKKSGVSISRYANDEITWETSRKSNLGIEIGLIDKFEIQVDVFHEDRSNILLDRISLATMGLQSKVRSNIGGATSKGIDASLDYNQTFRSGWWIQGRVNFTYATSKMTQTEEPDYSKTPWLSHLGQSINQEYGLIAERLFIDENEVANSPTQSFGKYAGGDIKYRDINADGIISNLDVVPIGNPTSPDIVYGLGFSVGYKAFDFSTFFQGLANESFWVDPKKSAPFINTLKSGLGNNQLLKVWSDSYWSESNPDIYARWPRLTNQVLANNNQKSTWFMQDGSFIRLKSVEIGFTAPKSVPNLLQMSKIRLYVSGTNLLTFSMFKLWDPEMGEDGLGYPVQRVFNVGGLIEF